MTPQDREGLALALETGILALEKADSLLTRALPYLKRLVTIDGGDDLERLISEVNTILGNDVRLAS